MSYNNIDPPHYLHPSGIDAILICERLAFCPGSLFKYMARAGKKPTSPAAEDYQKAAWFARRAAENKLPIVVDDDADGVADLIWKWISGEDDLGKVAAAELLRRAILAEDAAARSATFELLDTHLLRLARHQDA